jgi:hypothetical protein
MSNVATGCKHTEGARHDCGYVNRRNKQIPLAEALAYQKAGRRPLEIGPAYTEWMNLWNRIFFACMDKLTGRAG